MQIANSDLNDLFLLIGDIYSAYLKAFTPEKCCSIAGPEYGPVAGILLDIVRAH
jgi:hypothetical protein